MFELYEVITNNHIFRLGMYAVLKTGGKQYKVQKDSKLLVEKIEANVGDEVLFNEVLLIGDGEKINFGSPKIEDAAVLAEVIQQTRGPKITIIYKFYSSIDASVFQHPNYQIIKFNSTIVSYFRHQ